MKNLKRQLRLTILSLSTLCLLTGAYGQITPSGDAYTNTADPTTNYGAKPLLDVESASQNAYVQFDLSSLPASYTSANITKATLKLYVNTVTTAGSFNVDFVNGAWSEKAITANLSPALGTTIAASVPLTSANVHDYIIIDITSALGAWLNGTQANDGIALVGNSPFNASFDSKENTTMSHPPELDVVFAGGGTITGITTASGSGLIGGGTSGTLNLSLTNTCASNQVLQWNGSAWACASVATGTITGVTAGTDITGGGTSGNVTLNLDTTKVPQLVANNSFTGNQSVAGNVSATGTVGGGVVNATTSFNLAGQPFGFGSFNNQNVSLGFAGNSSPRGGANTAVGVLALWSNAIGSYNTATGDSALFSNTGGAYNTATGFSALFNNTNGAFNTANGYLALYDNTTGNYNTAIGVYALETDTTGSDNTASGYQALVSNTTGSDNTASGYQSLAANTTASGNTASGSLTLAANTTGPFNTASGYQALAANTTASGNTASGYRALAANTTGQDNTAIGASALAFNTTGNENIAVGYYALLDNTTGSNNIGIGYAAGPDSGNLSNTTAIGANAVVSQGDSVVLGGTGLHAVYVGIDTPTPSNVFTVGQSYGHAIADGWDTYSSRRWKTNIHTLHGALAKVEQLRGVSYDLKETGKHEVGVIAEEVGTVVPEIVSWEKNGKDAQGVDYSRLTALLIEATKEQQLLIRKQQRQIETQQTQMKAQQAQIARLASEVSTIQVSMKHGNSAGGAKVHTAQAQMARVHQ
jgi:hypothetical protein